ncbi:MAG: AI-2E family transporter [Vallitaleaceae bacterium]|nr:AI-2E family transporter [Vallitaleaceae bacterium]
MKLDWNKKYTTIAVYAILVFLFCYGTYKFTNDWDNTVLGFTNIVTALSPFLYSFLIAYFLNPLMAFIERTFLHKITKFKVKRTLSIISTYTVVFGLIILLMSFVFPQLVDSIQEVGKLPAEYIPKIQTALEKGSMTIPNTDYYVDLSLVSEYFSDNIASTLSSASNILSSFGPKILIYLTGLASGLFNILLGCVIAIYLLASKEAALLSARRIVLAIFSPKHAINIINLSKESNFIFINFIIGKLIDSLIIGILCFLSLLIFKFPYPLLLSVVVGVTNIIPFFGPFIGGFVGFALLLFINPIQALWYMLFILVLQQLDGNVIGPKILGDSTGLSSFWVIFAILIFGKIFGVAGMFLGVPIVAVIKNIFKREIDILYNNKMSNL